MMIQTMAKDKDDQAQSTLDAEIEADLKANIINIWHLNSKAMFYFKTLMPLFITLAIASVVVYILYCLLDFIKHKI
jgi:hypothetical protein